MKFYYLDLIKHRGISNALAEIFSVYQETPQLLMIKKGTSIYITSHYDI